MKPIPISAGENIAKTYGYDQVIIYARKVGNKTTGGEHLTTYGVNKLHCSVAAKIGDYLKSKIIGWYDKEPSGDEK